ncbi:amino acid adenylation domain-containing protein [Paenibacillus motobuensis]|uniref:Carrier domain-containing protein n=1 Tax=Paenibacillus motobuensis TaxID=295324 RepID=A0ABN0YAL6_9BACL
MESNNKGSLEDRVGALSEMKRKLLESLLEEQRAQKRTALLHEKGKTGMQKREPGLTVLPSTYMQRKFWYVEQLHDQSIAYNLSGYVQFHGKLRPELLHRAFADVCMHQEALRSVFKEAQGSLQVELRGDIGDEAFKLCDLSGKEHGAGMPELELLMYEEGIRPFPLSQGPLIRLIVYKLGDSDWIGQIVWHHIVSDGYSIGIFIKELLQRYEGYAGGSGLSANETDLQYYDYVIHFNQRAEQGEFDDQLQFWREHLAGSSLSCTIPADYRPTHEQDYQGDRVLFEIGQPLRAELETAAKRHGVTLFVLLLSALKVMLHKYINQNDIIIGVPVAGRNDERLQAVVGCFLNMLPIRSRLHPEQPLFDYIRSENEQVLQALRNQDIPFDRIVEELGVERDLLSTPVYQVIFSYETDVLHDIQTKDFSIAFGELDLKTAKVELALEINEAGSGLKGWFEYKSGKFSRERIQRITDYYLQIVEQFAARHNCAIGEIEMITAEEERRILYEFNRPSAGYRAQTIKQLFEAQAEARKEAVAAVCGDERITYGELNRRSNQLAHYLRKQGVGAERVVGILLDKSIEALVAILGVSKAGGAFMALDSSYPEERISYMLEDSAAHCVITSGAGDYPRLPGVPEISIFDQAIAAEPSADPSDAAGPESLAYLIYTSGTTGKPKGVMVEHAGIVNLRDYFIGSYAISAEDTVLQFANLVFDASVWELVMGLLTGAKLCIVSKETVLDPGRFESEMLRHHVTVATLPPQYWKEIAHRKLGLRLLITAGSASNRKLVEQLPSGLVYYNAYGPSETTVCASDWRYERDKLVPDKIPIGRPIPNMQIYMMNGDRLCGIGVIGELCAAGVGVARGYLNMPELTAEKFIDNPWGPGKLYRTGDYACWLEDGSIAFFGRMDHQVKIRGHRIESGEIEAVLHSHKNVIHAVVTVEEETSGEPSLAAYLVADERPGLAEIRDFLKERLPAYMLPSAYFTVDTIPLNVNGKVDTRQLAVMRRKLEAESHYVAPATETEKKLERIWSRLLGVERVSVKDSFFEIGGDSIISMQVIARAAEEGIKLELKSFYEDKCIEQMALRAVPLENVQDNQGEVTGVYPLTPIQRWFFNNEFQEADHWNQSVCLELALPPEPGILNDALNELCRQHDALRTRVASRAGGRTAEIMPYVHCPRLETADLSGNGEAEPLMQAAIAGLQRSLRPEAGEMFKGLLIRRGQERRDRLVLTAHHLVCDAYSLRLIVEDLFHFYEALAAGQEAAPRSKTVSYPQWSREAEAYAGSFEAAAKIGEWNKELEKRRLTAGSRTRADAGYEGEAGLWRSALSEEATFRLFTEVPKHYSIRPMEAMLAAMGIMLRAEDGTCPAIYIESHGRDRFAEQSDVSRTVGWFTQLYPLYLDDAAWPDLGSALKKVKDGLAVAQKRSFEFLLANYTRGPVEMVFNYMGQLDSGSSGNSPFRIIGGESLGARGPGNARVGRLEVNAYVLNGRLTLEWVYSARRESEKSLCRQARAFEQALLEIIEYCIESEDSGTSVSDFYEVDTEDLDLILSKFN